MQRSNTYIVIFSLALTIVLGGLLSLASEGLKPIQKRAEELSTKRQILRAVMEIGPDADVLNIFDNRITFVAINARGEEVETNEEGETLDPVKLDVAREFKKDPSERIYPVFKYHDPGDEENIKAYIFALYGNGLWDNIWGYIALQPDMDTIEGAVFDHASETPGLGARITDEAIQNRYKGKKVFNDEGELIGVDMLKSENNPAEALDEHNINGLSGATITAKGVNRMIENYLGYYLPYIDKIRAGDQKLAKLLN